jgi:hypothetical protein
MILAMIASEHLHSPVTPCKTEHVAPDGSNGDFVFKVRLFLAGVLQTIVFLLISTI